MSKKKNTLKDLDEFLKQQAASLVPPEPVVVSPATEPEKPEVFHSSSIVDISHESLLADLQALAKKEPQAFRKEFYGMIVSVLESYPSSSAEDKMLINTALYLKSGDRWKDVIREYWKTKS
jgi:hypothetical protein